MKEFPLHPQELSYYFHLVFTFVCYAYSIKLLRGSDLSFKKVLKT